MSRRYRGRGSSDGSGLIAMAIIAVVALPVVGLYKIVKGDEDDKALGAGLLTGVIRIYGGYPEGVTYAILIMNAAVWILDFYTAPRRFGFQ